jgi:hypothetical protein
MKINYKILSIPPFISTSWKNILSLHMEHYDSRPSLIVSMTNGNRVELPPLDPPIVEAIFAAHAKFLEMEQVNQNKAIAQSRPSMEGFLSLGVPPFKLNVSHLENLGAAALQHNPEQADSPDLPKEIIGKIVAISKAMGIEDPSLLPKAEPHCNCMHCQIARALQGDGKTEKIEEKEDSELEEVVSEEDLKFRLWDVVQTSEELYCVSNPLDTDERYNVFLGEPIGCTCGGKNCEHVRAVLNS